MAPSFIAAIIGILSVGLPLINVHVAPDALTTTVTVICLIVVAVRQVITGRSTTYGARPQGFTG